MNPEHRAAALIFLALLAVFVASPIRQLTDSWYTLLLSEQLLVSRSFALDEYFYPNADSRSYPGTPPGAYYPRHVQPGGVRRGKDVSAPLYYIYPHGSSILSVPLVAVARGLGVSTIGEDGAYNPQGELRIQAAAAALLMACAGALFFLTARLLLPLGWSLLVTLAASLGSQVWSTASRGMWTHTWAMLLLTCAVFLLVRHSAGRGKPHPWLLATLLSWCFFTRPTMALCIPPFALFLLLQRRRQFWPFLAGGLIWLTLFLVYSRSLFGTFVPNYFTRGANLGFAHLADGFVAGLLSPSRGLLVFVPWILMVGYGLVVYRRQLDHRPLMWAMLLALAAHVAVLTSFRGWHAGECYGARYSTDALPLIVALAILALRGAVSAAGDAPRHRGRRRLELSATALLIAIAILFNGAGAISQAGAQWNGRPTPIGKSRERIFDWKHSQWATALFPRLLQPEQPADERGRRKRER